MKKQNLVFGMTVIFFFYLVPSIYIVFRAYCFQCLFELFDRTDLKLFGLRGTLGRIRNTLLNFATKNIFFGGLTVFSVCLNSLTKLALSYSGLGAHWVELGSREKGKLSCFRVVIFGFH